MPTQPKAPKGCYWRGDTLWGRTKVRGVEHRASLRTADLREAKTQLAAWRRRLVREAAAAAEAPPEVIRYSYKAAVVRWEAEVLPGAVKPQVQRRYMTSMRLLHHHFADLTLDQITTRTIADYVSARTQGKKVRKATNATIRRDLTALSRLLSACVAWGWTTENPARNFDRSIIRERRDPIRLPLDEDVELVISHAPEGMRPLIRLLDATGMREAEAVNLERGDIDWEQQLIRLTKTKTSRPRTLRWATPGGDAGGILTGAVTRLRSSVLFPNRDGEPYRNFASNFAKAVRDAMADAEERGIAFRRFRAHDLRHRFAVRSLEREWSIYALSKHLGHTSVKTTEIYLDHLPPEKQDVVRGVAQPAAQPAPPLPLRVVKT